MGEGVTNIDDASPEAMRRVLKDVIALRDELAGDRSIVSNAIAAKIDRALKGQRTREGNGD